MTEKSDTPHIFDKVLRYDGGCAICTRLAERFAGLLGRRGIHVAPLPDDDPKTEIKLTLPDGTFGGAAALRRLCREYWWALPLHWLGKIPAIRSWLDTRYRAFAARRLCYGGACRLVSQRSSATPASGC